MTDLLTAQDFEPHVGKTVQPAEQRQVLTLIKVEINEAPGWEDAPRQPFTLILRGQRGDVLPEGFYEVAFTDGPRSNLYIIPIYTMARGHQDYQVVFN